MNINWKRIYSYDEAKYCKSSIYVHSWKNEFMNYSYCPYYIGMLYNSSFGGKNGRYNSAYAHWINGCLDHGAVLHIGEVSVQNSIEGIENQLIWSFLPDANKIYKVSKLMFQLENKGDVPEYLKNYNPGLMVNRTIINYFTSRVDDFRRLVDCGLSIEPIEVIINQTYNSNNIIGVEPIRRVINKILGNIEELPKKYIVKKIKNEIEHLLNGIKPFA